MSKQTTERVEEPFETETETETETIFELEIPVYVEVEISSQIRDNAFSPPPSDDPVAAFVSANMHCIIHIAGWLWYWWTILRQIWLLHSMYALYALSCIVMSANNLIQEADPTRGYVSYVNTSIARDTGLISASGGSAYFGVDNINQAWGSGRRSVRLTSHQAYNHGLFILDLAHMPGSVCGTWPALWVIYPGLNPSWCLN